MTLVWRNLGLQTQHLQNMVHKQQSVPHCTKCIHIEQLRMISSIRLHPTSCQITPPTNASISQSDPYHEPYHEPRRDYLNAVDEFDHRHAILVYVVELSHLRQSKDANNAKSGVDFALRKPKLQQTN